MKKFESEDLVVLVHGTFANTDKGWASIQDKFHQQLNIAFYKKMGYHFNFTTFSWSGLNSQNERQHSGINLTESLNIMSSNFKRIHLIGHSHGGSVIQFAIQKESALISNKWKKKLCSWTTVGTPFFRYDGNLKYKDSGIFMASMPGAVLITIGLCLILSVFGSTNKIIFILLYVLIYSNLNAYLDAKSIQYRLDRANQYYAQKWFGIYSKNDEAIAGLRSTLKFKLKDEKKKYPTLSGDYDLLSYLRRFISTLIFNSVFRKLYQRILSSKIKNYGLGLDKKYYKVSEVSFKPYDKMEVQQMPKWLEEDIYEEVVKDNVTKIDELRKLINVGNNNIFEIVMNLEDKNKPLLIHTNYFENLAVIETIAQHLSKRIKKEITNRKNR